MAMETQLILLDTPSLAKKGVRRVAYHKTNETMRDITDVWVYVNRLRRIVEEELGIEILETVFTDNEDIGTNYMIYRFRYILGEGYIGCRVVTREGRHILTVLTIGG